MGKFLDTEKERQTEFKRKSKYFTTKAQADGIYRKIPRPFCIPRENADENLYFEIRQSALEYFTCHNIRWHDGKDYLPSNHLCDSQVCCVNFLYPFSDKPKALAELLRPIFPTIQQILPMESSGRFVSFEWIGELNYLGEGRIQSGKRSRGAHFTSADGAVMFLHRDGKRQIVLMEWKYTESNRATFLGTSPNGTDRTETYTPFYDREDCPLDRTKISNFEDLFYDPFDQLMRQQFLADEMERAKELGADKVSLLHIAPDQNYDIQKIKSSSLKELGATAIEVWHHLVREEGKFASVSVEKLYQSFPIQRFPELQRWWDYMTQRYQWLS